MCRCEFGVNIENSLITTEFIYSVFLTLDHCKRQKIGLHVMAKHDSSGASRMGVQIV